MPHDQPYLLAKKKIEEALKSGATELDLRNMKLTKLLESTGKSRRLLKLDLGRDYQIIHIKVKKVISSNLVRLITVTKLIHGIYLKFVFETS